MTAAECLCKLSPGETLGELSLRLEEEAGTPREKALEKLSGMLSVMESEVQNALHIPVHSISGLTGGTAAGMSGTGYPAAHSSGNPRPRHRLRPLGL